MLDFIRLVTSSLCMNFLIASKPKYTKWLKVLFCLFSSFFFPLISFRYLSVHLSVSRSSRLIVWWRWWMKRWKVSAIPQIIYHLTFTPRLIRAVSICEANLLMEPGLQASGFLMCPSPGTSSHIRNLMFGNLTEIFTESAARSIISLVLAISMERCVQAPPTLQVW